MILAIEDKSLVTVVNGIAYPESTDAFETPIQSIHIANNGQNAVVVTKMGVYERVDGIDKWQQTASLHNQHILNVQYIETSTDFLVFHLLEISIM